MKALAIALLIAGCMAVWSCGSPPAPSVEVVPEIEEEEDVMFLELVERTDDPAPRKPVRELDIGDGHFADLPDSSEGHGIIIYEEHFGAAVASVEERIYLSDIVVRARLLSSANNVLTFRALEYLKGSGPSQFTIGAATAGRNTEWDGREAVLFLEEPESSAGGASGQSGSARFEFSDTTKFEYREGYGDASSYTGNLDDGYNVDSANPVWLPSESDRSGRNTRNAGESSFIDSSNEKISLTDLKAKIAWVGGGAGVEGYDDCIKESLAYIRYHRDWETHEGEPVTIFSEQETIASGTVGDDFGKYTHVNREPKYMNVWVEGKDAVLFTSYTVDDDNDPTNGYTRELAAARPLPAGTYEIVNRNQSYHFQACNFKPQFNQLAFTVTVTAPEGTVHEAFFDPAETNTGYDAAKGRLNPSGFRVGHASPIIRSLKWQNNKVTMHLRPFNALAGLTVQLINEDGTTAVSLPASEATAEGEFLSWDVTEQPWVAGKKMMLRIYIAPNPPVFAQDSYTFTVAENAGLYTIAGTVQATDANAGDKISYTITSGADGKFQVDANEGWVLVRGSLDYETKNSYTLTVEAKDVSGLTDTATVEITVTDVAE